VAKSLARKARGVHQNVQRAKKRRFLCLPRRYRFFGPGLPCVAFEILGARSCRVAPSRWMGPVDVAAKSEGAFAVWRWAIEYLVPALISQSLQVTTDSQSFMARFSSSGRELRDDWKLVKPTALVAVIRVGRPCPRQGLAPDRCFH
jgi:hypothetical protein